MHLQDHQMLVSYWDVLVRIQYAIDADDKAFAELMNLTLKNFLSLKNKLQPPPTTAIVHLLGSLHLSMDRFLDRSIDFTVLKGNVGHHVEVVPQRYLPAAFSRRRTSHALLSFILTHFGAYKFIECLKHFQVRESIFENPDNPINVLMASDLCDYLSKQLKSKDALFKVGQLSHLIPANSVFKRILGNQYSPSESYGKIIEELMDLFDKNCLYRLKYLSETECTVSMKPNLEVVELLKAPIPWSRASCSYRMGVISSFPGFSGWPLSSAREESCLHNGDSECSYSFQFEKAASVFKTQISRGNFN